MIVRPVARREWSLHGSLALEAGAMALGLTVLGTLASPGFALLIALVVAGQLATRLAGDERLNGLLEFILTRPIPRSSWVLTRFFLGLSLPLFLVAWTALADGLSFHSLFGRLLAEPVSTAPLSHPVLTPYATVACFITMQYAITWWFAQRERRPDAVRSQIWPGLFASKVLTVVFATCSVLLTTPDDSLQTLPFLASSPQSTPSAILYALMTLSMSSLALGLSVRHRNRQEVEATPAASTAGTSSWLWFFLVLLVVIALTLFIFFLLAAPSASPSMEVSR